MQPRRDVPELIVARRRDVPELFVARRRDVPALSVERWREQDATAAGCDRADRIMVAVCVRVLYREHSCGYHALINTLL